MNIRKRIKRSDIEKLDNGHGPCRRYTTLENHYTKYIPIGGISLNDFLYLPIPFLDKIFVLASYNGGWFEQYPKLMQNLQDKFFSRPYVYFTTSACSNYQTIAPLPTTIDRNFAESILQIVKNTNEKKEL